MGMLNLFGGGDRHPLHDEEAARILIAQLPSEDSLRSLGDIAQWLRSVAESAEFKLKTRLAVIGLLDDAGRKPERALLLRYFNDPRLRNAAGRLAWNTVYGFWSALAEGYQRCALEDIPARPLGEAARDPLASLAARALRARVGHLRAAMLHYEPVPAAAWSGLYRLLARCEQAELVHVPTHAYPAERLHTTPLRELMKGLLVAIAAPERLPPEEVEAAYRIAQRFAGAAKLESAPFEGATHVVDLERGEPPAPIDANTAPAGELRYFGAREAVAKLERMIGHQESSMLDEDERLAREYSPGQKVTVLRQFMNYWGSNPPHAEKSLIRLEGGLGVVHGFGAVCHYVPHAASQAAEDKARAQPGAQKLGVVEEDEIEIPESWPGRDAGLHAVHAQAAPGVGAWAEVGDLAAIRVHDRSDWWLAVIRRLELAEGGALQAEFEVLSRKPLSVWLRVLGRQDRMAANWESASGSFAFEYLQSVVLTDRAAPGRAPTLILPKGRYVPGQILELLHGERSRLLKFTEFLEQGKDYDWCAIEWRAKPD